MFRKWTDWAFCTQANHALFSLNSPEPTHYEWRRQHLLEISIASEILLLNYSTKCSGHFSRPLILFRSSQRLSARKDTKGSLVPPPVCRLLPYSGRWTTYIPMSLYTGKCAVCCSRIKGRVDRDGQKENTHPKPWGQVVFPSSTLLGRKKSKNGKKKVGTPSKADRREKSQLPPCRMSTLCSTLF